MSRSRREFVRLAAVTGALTAAGWPGVLTRAQEDADPPGDPARWRRVQVGKSPRPLRLLILGGTGFLGPHTVDHARARGHVLTLFNRGRTNPGLFPDVETILGDRDGKLDGLKGRTWDAVIDNSGYVPRIVKMSADLLAPSTGQYVFISTISVFGESPKPGADESHPVETLADPTTEEVRQFYGGLKALCEKAAEASMPGRATVIRPGLIVGPMDTTDRFTYWPVRLAAGGDVLAPGDGSDPVQFVDVRDLAAFVVKAVEDKSFGTFNATGPADELRMSAFLDTCRTAVGSTANLVWADAAFLEKMEVAPWGDMPVWVPGTGQLAGFGRIDCRRAGKAGLAFRPLADTARDTLDWWRTLPVERTAKLKAGIAPDREKVVLEAWRQARAAATPR